MKVGVVGVGYWGTKVLGEYVQLVGDGPLEAVYACDPSRDARAAARTNGASQAFSELGPMLEQVDAVHVATRNQHHYATTKQALEAGVHVLLEKPMTTDPATSFELAELASAQGVVLQTGHIYRFNEAIRRIGAMVRSGEFGDIHYYKIAWTTKMPSPEGIDILWDLLPHPLDIMHNLTGKWPVSYTGAARAFTRPEPNEVAFIQAGFDDGSIAAIELSWLRPIRRRTLEIVGSRRDAIVDCVGQQVEIVENGEMHDLGVEPNNTIRDELEHFLSSIQSGKNPHNSAIIGARNVEQVAKAIQSVER